MKELNLIINAIKKLFDGKFVDADIFLDVCMNLSDIKSKLPKFKLTDGKSTKTIAYYDSWSKQLLFTNENYKKFRKYKIYLFALLVYLNDVDQLNTRFICISDEINFYRTIMVSDDICWSLSFPRYSICEGNELLKMDTNFSKVNKYLLRMNNKSCYVWKENIKKNYVFNSIDVDISGNANVLNCTGIDRSTNKKITLETLVEILFI